MNNQKNMDMDMVIWIISISWFLILSFPFIGRTKRYELDKQRKKTFILKQNITFTNWL